GPVRRGASAAAREPRKWPRPRDGIVAPGAPPGFLQSSADITRTALCAEPRNGTLYIFMPPTQALEDYLELVAAIEATAADLATPVVLEGYEPPRDPRLDSF